MTYFPYGMGITAGAAANTVLPGKVQRPGGVPGKHSPRVKYFHDVNPVGDFFHHLRPQRRPPNRVKGVRDAYQSTLGPDSRYGLLHGQTAGYTLFQKHTHNLTVRRHNLLGHDYRKGG